MRAWMLRAALVTALLAGVGCGDEQRSETPDVSAANVKQKLEEAADASADSMAAQRRDLAGRAQRSVDEVTKELLEAREQLTTLPEQARGPLELAIDRTERARDELGAQLKALQQAGLDQWEDMRDGVTAALGDLADARRELGAVLVGDDEEVAPSGSS